MAPGEERIATVSASLLFPTNVLKPQGPWERSADIIRGSQDLSKVLRPLGASFVSWDSLSLSLPHGWLKADFQEKLGTLPLHKLFQGFRLHTFPQRPERSQ